MESHLNKNFTRKKDVEIPYLTALPRLRERRIAPKESFVIGPWTTWT